MVGLLDTQIVVAHRSYRHCIHMVGIVKTVMVIVVASCCNHACNLVQMIKFGKLYQSPLSVHQEQHLHNISSMQVVMVCHTLSVPLLNLIQKSN